MTEKRFSSSEVLKIFQITRPTLRYYMDKGLIKGKKDPESGYLSFGENDLNDLADVSFFRRILDFSTKELDGYFRASSLTDYSSVLFMHKELLKQEIRKREKQLEILSLMEEWLDMVMETENKIREIHFDEEYSILAPLKNIRRPIIF